MTSRPKLLCATGNAQKFALGKLAFDKKGVDLEQVFVDIDEIQGEDPEVILADKARKAFAIVGAPVVVSDDSWSIPALKGFPGAYMKSMNHWLEPSDFLHLMQDKDDRTVHLDQRLAYIDEDGIVTFNKRLTGVIVKSPKGETGPPIMRIVELEDDGMTISEAFDAGIANRKGVERDAWKDAASWFASR
jgi:XTP/dITP diphosphohydrolase